MYQRDKTLMEQKISLISAASQWKSTTKRTDDVIQKVFAELIKADLELLKGYFVTYLLLLSDFVSCEEKMSSVIWPYVRQC